MMSQGRLSEAIQSFEVALDINSLFTRARSKLAVCLFQKGRKSHAMKLLSEYDSLDKDMIELHYKIALLYCDKLKFASSMINLERYLENNYACPDASFNISIVLQNLGMLDRVTVMWDNISDMAGQMTNID